METRLATCKPSDHVRVALQIMREAKVRRLPVVTEDGVIEGIVSIDDIVRNIRRDFGNPDAVSAGEMVTALQDIFTRGNRSCFSLSCSVTFFPGDDRRRSKKHNQDFQKEGELSKCCLNPSLEMYLC